MIAFTWLLTKVKLCSVFAICTFLLSQKPLSKHGHVHKTITSNTLTHTHPDPPRRTHARHTRHTHAAHTIHTRTVIVGRERSLGVSATLHTEPPPPHDLYKPQVNKYLTFDPPHPTAEHERNGDRAR